MNCTATHTTQSAADRSPPGCCEDPEEYKVVNSSIPVDLMVLTSYEGIVVTPFEIDLRHLRRLLLRLRGDRKPVDVLSGRTSPTTHDAFSLPLPDV